jgi:hypothetical protein
MIPIIDTAYISCTNYYLCAEISVLSFLAAQYNFHIEKNLFPTDLTNKNKCVTHLIQGKYNLEPAGSHLSHRQQVQRDRVWKSDIFIFCFYEFYCKATFLMNKTVALLQKLTNPSFANETTKGMISSPEVLAHVFLLMKGKSTGTKYIKIKHKIVNVAFRTKFNCRNIIKIYFGLGVALIMCSIYSCRSGSDPLGP